MKFTHQVACSSTRCSGRKHRLENVGGMDGGQLAGHSFLFQHFPVAISNTPCRQEESLKPSEVLKKSQRRLECHNLKNDFKLLQHTLHTYLPYFNYICKSHRPRAFLSFSSFALVCGPFTSFMHFKFSTFDVAWISLGLSWAKNSKFMCKIAQNQHQIPCPSANLPASFANLWQISSGFVALHRWDETCCDSLPPCWWWPQDGFMSPNRPSSNPSPYIFSDELK